MDAASAGVLAAGFYRVQNTWATAAELPNYPTATTSDYVTYWDGTDFNPPLPNDYLVSKFLDLYWPSSQLTGAFASAIDSWTDVLEGVAVTNTGANRPTIDIMAGRRVARGLLGGNRWLESRHAKILELGNTATTPKLAMFAITDNYGDAFKYHQNFANDAGTVWLSAFTNSTQVSTNTKFNDGATPNGMGQTITPGGGVMAIYIIASDGDHIRAYSRLINSATVDGNGQVTITGTKARTIDFYSVCSFGTPFPAIGSRAKILTHGIAGGAKAQALYDDPAAFVSALSAVYGL